MTTKNVVVVVGGHPSEFWRWMHSQFENKIVAVNRSKIEFTDGKTKYIYVPDALRLKGLSFNAARMIGTYYRRVNLAEIERIIGQRLSSNVKAQTAKDQSK